MDVLVSYLIIRNKQSLLLNSKAVKFTILKKNVIVQSFLVVRLWFYGETDNLRVEILYFHVHFPVWEAFCAYNCCHPGRVIQNPDNELFFLKYF